jgi:hypothetical protein
MYRLMHVLVEGRDDREFFDAVVRPVLQGQYDHVQIWEYAGAPIDKRIDYLRSIQAMKADYLFVTDINTSPCITERKRHLLDSHKNAIDPGCAIIVRREIESWYMAGVDDQACQEFGITSISHTNDVTKEQFRNLMPKRFNDSVVDFMTAILTGFRVELARGKNRSFCYLMDKLEARSKKV